MILGRVIGTVVASQKHAKFLGSTLLLVQPQDLEGRSEGDAILAVDTVGAGASELVLVVVEGRSASQAMRRDEAPANAAIVGIVDRVDVDPGALRSSPEGNEP